MKSYYDLDGVVQNSKISDFLSLLDGGFLGRFLQGIGLNHSDISEENTASSFRVNDLVSFI